MQGFSVWSWDYSLNPQSVCLSEGIFSDHPPDLLKQWALRKVRWAPQSTQSDHGDTAFPTQGLTHKVMF